MPYKQGKMKGELTSAEIRRLISAHNKLSKITIPKGTKRDGLLKLVETNGFRVDHKNEKLIQTRSKPLMKIDLPPKKKRVKKLSSAEAKKLLGGDLPKENYGGQSTQAKKPPPVKKPPVKKPPVKKQVLSGQDTKDKDILNDIISSWGEDVNNVVIQQNLKKLNNGIISLWDTNKKFINIDGIFQFNKSLFNRLFMKYPAQKVIDGLENFMLYTTDSSDNERIGQNEFKKWFQVKDGRTQSNIRGKDLNVSVLTKLQKEWDNKFLKKKEEKKSKEQILKTKVNTNSIEKNKEMVNKDNIDFNELMKKISLPLQYLKQTAPRKEAMTQVSTLLLDKNISYDNFVDIIDNLELYHQQFSIIGGFSFKKGEAPPKWRMPLSKMVRDAFNSNDKKKDWKAWTDRIPKKGVKLAPSSDEVDEKILKSLEDGKKLLETFLKENKGFEKKDYTNLKNKKSYQESLKNYDNFIKGYNSIISAVRAVRKKSTTPEIEKKVNEYKEKSVKIRNTIERVYKYRKTPNKGKLTVSF